MKLPTLDVAIAINATVLDIDVVTAQRATNVSLLDSALHAASAGFGDTDLYPEPWQKIGVLCSRVVLNHPFVDGNTRTGFLLMLDAAETNGLRLEFDDQHEVSDMIEGLAAREIEESEFLDYIRRRLG